MLWNNDPSSNHFVVPVTGFAGQRTSRRKALPIKLKYALDSRASGEVWDDALESVLFLIYKTTLRLGFIEDSE